MGDMADVFSGMRAASKKKRGDNRLQGAVALMEAGVPYTVYNDGAHIVISRPKPFVPVDYWPGTGLWCARGWRRSEYRRGVASLLRFLKGGKNKFDA